MRTIISALVATLALATSAYAAPARVVYVDSLDKGTNDKIETVYNAMELEDQKQIEAMKKGVPGAMTMPIAKITTVYNRSENRYEASFVWNGEHDGVVSDEVMVQIARSNLCNVANGRACLVTENGSLHGFYTRIEDNGSTRSVYSATFTNKVKGTTLMPMNKDGEGVIYTWQKMATTPTLGAGVCTLVADLDLSSFHFVFGGEHTRDNAEGTGSLDCWYVTGQSTHTPVNVGVKGYGVGFGIANVHAKMVAGGLTISWRPEEVFGNYYGVVAGVHIVEAGLRVGVGMNLQSVTNAALTIDADLMYTQGLGVDASVNIDQISINPTTDSAALHL